MSSAAAPATCGAAMLVPLQACSPAGVVERMPTPGAMMSMSAPKLLKRRERVVDAFRAAAETEAAAAEAAWRAVEVGQGRNRDHLVVGGGRCVLRVHVVIACRHHQRDAGGNHAANRRVLRIDGLIAGLVVAAGGQQNPTPEHGPA